MTRSTQEEGWSQAMKKRRSFMASRIARVLFRLMGGVMDSRLRYRLSHPTGILEGAGIRPGQDVLEIGCGTGFFTIPAAGLVGDQGHVYAMDPHPLAIEEVTRKIRDAKLANVRLIRADATEAGLASGCVDLALLLGVIPAPMIPLQSIGALSMDG